MLILWETGSEQLMDDANRNVAAVLTLGHSKNHQKSGKSHLNISTTA